jgi:hypothetical protein
MFAARSSASVEILGGDLNSAERELRAALKLALEFRERNEISKIAAGLSRLLSGRDEAQEAERLARMSFDFAPAEGVAPQALWRAATARGLASRGGHREAERLAREAARLAPVEMPNLQADLLIDLAHVVRAGGDRKATPPIIETAIALYERKGNVVSAARARASPR